MRAKAGTATLNELARGPRLAAQVARWVAGRPSILAVAPSHVHLFWQSFDGLTRPTCKACSHPDPTNRAGCTSSTTSRA